MCNITLERLKEKDPRGWFVHQVQLWVTGLAVKYGFGEKFQCGSSDIVELWETLQGEGHASKDKS